MLNEFAKVAAGVGALIALGLILSRWQGTVEITRTAGGQVNELVRTLSLQGSR